MTVNRPARPGTAAMRWGRFFLCPIGLHKHENLNRQVATIPEGMTSGYGMEKSGAICSGVPQIPSDEKTGEVIRIQELERVGEKQTAPKPFKPDQ